MFFSNSNTPLCKQAGKCRRFIIKYVSENDQEMPQSHTADQLHRGKSILVLILGCCSQVLNALNMMGILTAISANTNAISYSIFPISLLSSQFTYIMFLFKFTTYVDVMVLLFNG